MYLTRNGNDDVGYWRKANQIHNWFVTNVQNGNDDCGDYDVSPEKLRELRDVVNTVLKASKLVKGSIANGYTYDDNGNKVFNMEEGKVIEDSRVAETLLPTIEGFFFGGSHYDQYYMEDIENTKEILDKIFKEDPQLTEEYSYHSSW